MDTAAMHYRGLAVRRLLSVGAHEVALATLEALGDDEATKQRQHLSYFLWYLDGIDRTAIPLIGDDVRHHWLLVDARTLLSEQPHPADLLDDTIRKRLQALSDEANAIATPPTATQQLEWSIIRLLLGGQREEAAAAAQRHLSGLERHDDAWPRWDLLTQHLMNATQSLFPLPVDRYEFVQPSVGRLRLSVDHYTRLAAV